MSQNLEDSKLWKQTRSLAHDLRETVKLAFPYDEYYLFADPIQPNAVMLSTDIANAIGKNSNDSLFDYQSARGHRYTVKSLLLMAQDNSYRIETDNILTDLGLFTAQSKPKSTGWKNKKRPGHEN